ncbi:MAG: cupin domain-containing protein [Candidatus Altiarchaeota archaeon]|nr:cupin domain-containing protein [Candidatus Altiarchaeota archaeon]
MIIKKADRIRHKNSPDCIVYEYPFGDKDINIVFVEIRGRYPEKGQVTNRRSKEIVYVLEGSGKIVIEGTEHELAKGDAVMILPGVKYFFDGKLKVLLPCSPAWTREQHEHTD